MSLYLRFLSGFIFCARLCGSTLDLVGAMPNAYLLPRGQYEATLKYHRVNSALDILNFRDLSNSNSETIGDMEGMGLGLNFGISPNLTLLYDRDFNEYDFGRGILKVETEDLSLRRNLRVFPGLHQVLSMQIGYRKNKGSGLNKLFSNVTFNNASFTLSPTRKIEFGGVGDGEKSISLMLSRDFRNKWTGTLYGEWGHAQITNQLRTDLPVNELQEVLDVLEYRQTRKEAGYVLQYQMDKKNLLSFHYRYLLLNRDKDVSDPVRVNEILKGRYQLQTDPRRYWFVEGKYSKNQFVGDHSFLYNKRVASRSSRNYGHLSFGYTFRYGFGG